VTEWHINADEPSIIDYNVEFKNNPNCTSTTCTSPDFYTPTPYRASDHDPVIIGLNLTAPPPTPNGTIVIIKDAVPDDAQDFSFNLTNGSTISQNFFLDNDGDATLPNSQTFSVPAGTWTASELNIPADWTLTGLTCTDPSSNTTTNLANGTAAINVASSETVTCTFENTKQQTTPTEPIFSEYVEGSSNNKALEIYNGTGAAIDLAAGSYNVLMSFNGGTSTLTVNLTGTVANGDVFVLAHGAADPAILAVADQTSATTAGWFNGDDAIVLRKGATILDVIGQIGFDPGSEWGTGLTSTADNTLRRKAAIQTGDTNGSDAFDPSIEWDGFATNTISGLGCHALGCPINLTVSDVSANEGNSGTTTFTFTVNLSEAARAGGVTFDIATANGTATTADNDYVTKSLTGQTIPAGSSTYSFDVSVNGDTNFEPNETFYVNVTNVVGATLVDDQGLGAINNDDVAPTLIREIQGASHTSPLVGQSVFGVAGIVTAKVSNGFYMQDPSPDANDTTSEAIFVFTSSAPTVNVGDAVKVNGNVIEFRPGGSSSTNLTITEISAPTVTVNSTGNPLPAATVIGNGGRLQPTTIIEDDATGSVETSGTFDPASDGVDFYESMEAMRVQINNPVVVGPRNNFGEVWVLADEGSNASVRTTRGGIVIRPNDFNPERIQLEDTLAATPMVDVGDHFSTSAVGVLNYDFNNFEVLITSPLTAVSSGLAREATTPGGTNQLAVATFNVENLDPGDGAAKFNQLAGLIVNNLKSPDIIAVEEIQDNNGATNDGTVDATITFNTLIAAIQGAGGPAYSFRNIDPVNGQDGGEPGGNIRVGFLFRTDRDLSFVDRPGGTSTSTTTVSEVGGVPVLSASPGRIDPTNAAFNASRKPLVGEFTYHGQTLFVIANHFNSKGGDQPLFGRFQPPTLSSEAQRVQQAQIVNNFVDSILAIDANANVVIAGDLNDFEFSTPVNTLEGGVLNTLMETLPQNERYSYVFDGNSQSLDHILISNNLFNNASFEYDVIHVNAEFADQASDHDPQVVRLTINASPTVDAGGPYSINEGQSVAVSATGTDPGDTLTYAWDLDNNGSFETSGQNATFSAAGLNGPSSYTIKVQVTDLGGLTAVDEATVNVQNTAPIAVNDSYSVNEDTPLTVTAPGVLANDSDVIDSLTAVVASSPAHGTLTLNANGSFTYTPNSNYNGSDSFTYKANDGTDDSMAATVSITVNAVNDAPTVAVAAGGMCGANSNGTMYLAVSDLDNPSGDLTLSASSSDTQLVPNANIVFGGSGANRTVSITAVPQKSSKSAIITVTVSDGSSSTTSTIRVTVGTDKKETINGTAGADMIFGLNGDDTVNAGAGNDLVCGGNGAGTVNGGAGDDTIEGGNGNDILRGEDGNDILRGGAGNDRLEGGNNNDILTGDAGADFFSGGAGTDTNTDVTPSQGDTSDGT
jgi:VCBS repeat-containing protein